MSIQQCNKAREDVHAPSIRGAFEGVSVTSPCLLELGNSLGHTVVALTHRRVEWCELDSATYVTALGILVRRIRVTRCDAICLSLGRWIQLLWDG